jgi:isohexenylglutaconyl-CoA hydratase
MVSYSPLGATVPDGYAEAGAAAFGRQAAGPEAAEGIASFMARRKAAWAQQ